MRAAAAAGNNAGANHSSRHQRQGRCAWRNPAYFKVLQQIVQYATLLRLRQLRGVAVFVEEAFRFGGVWRFWYRMGTHRRQVVVAAAQEASRASSVAVAVAVAGFVADAFNASSKASTAVVKSLTFASNTGFVADNRLISPGVPVSSPIGRFAVSVSNLFQITERFFGAEASNIPIL